jgi:hypothetical protein
MVLVSGLPITTKVLLCIEASTASTVELTVWSLEVHDRVVVLEEVDFIDGLERLHAQLFDDGLDLLVVVHLP